MPHTPGNTPKTWRRLFYQTLAHGAKVINLFEIRPVQHAYTENHCSDPAMYQEIRKSLHELGTFEDIIQDGEVMPAKTAIFCSEAGDVWNNHRPPFDVAKRCRYFRIRQLQQPLDFVTEGDNLKGYKTIELCDANISQSASKAMAEWVTNGVDRTLIAHVGAGMFDEYNRPNKIIRDLLGVDQVRIEETKQPIRFEKQDLPFAEPLSQAIYEVAGKEDVFGIRSIIKADNARVSGKFKDGHPAGASGPKGLGYATYHAFVDEFDLFKKALPKRPIDRGATDDSMAHLLPRNVYGEPPPEWAESFDVYCSHSSIETTLVRSKQGTAVPLINWRSEPVRGLKVSINRAFQAAKITLASGRPVQTKQENGRLVCTLDLDVADALILRP
jgi:hypothetical protein